MKAVEISKSIMKAKQEQEQAVPIETQIRNRAYQLYEQRGRVEGHELEDWLQAESELTSTAKVA